MRDIDIGILKAIYDNRIWALDSTFIFFTDSAGVIAFGVPIIILFVAFRKKNTRLRQDAFMILIAVAISAILANILKYVFDVSRPFEVYPFIVKLSNAGSPSFPSGHTADAFAFAVAVALVFPKWYFIIPGLVWASLIGYSRMSLGVHFPSDVLAGAVLGAVTAFSYISYAKRKRQISP